MKKTSLINRIVSFVLALTMILGFLPSNLFPHAAALVATGSTGTSGGTLNLTIAEDGTYTLTFTSNFGNNSRNNVSFAIFPVKNTGVEEAIAAGNWNGADYVSLVTNYADSAIGANGTVSVTHDQSTFYFTNGQPTTLGTGTIKSDLYNELNTNYSSLKETDGSFKYIVVMAGSFGGGVHWAYASVGGKKLTGTDFTYQADGSKTTIVKNAKMTNAAVTTNTNTTKATGGEFTVGNSDIELAGFQVDLPNGSTYFNGADYQIVDASGSQITFSGSTSTKTLSKNTTYYFYCTNTKAVIPATNMPLRGTATLIYYHNNIRYEETINVTILLDSITWITTGSITVEGNEGNMSAATMTPTSPFTVTVTPSTSTVITDENKKAKFVSLTGGSYLQFTVPATDSEITSTTEFPFTLSTDGLALSAGTYTETWTLKYKTAVRGTTLKEITETIPVTIIVNPAQTDPTTYTITFKYHDGATGDTTDTTDTNGKLSSLPNPTRDHYTFDGWFDAETGGNQVTTSTTFSADDTLHAHWTPETYNVKFIYHDGTTSDVTKTTDANFKVDGWPSDPSRSGWTFDGWYTVATGGTKKESTDTFMENTELHAHWTKDTYTITFDENYTGGNTSYATKTTGTDGKISSLPSDPSRDGYTFDGWYDATTGGDQVTTSYVFTEPTTVYAHWTIKKYNVTFDPGSASTNVTTMPNNLTDVEYGKTLGYVTGGDYQIVEPTWTGHTFLGWATTSGATTASWTSGTKTVTDTITYYAVWQETNYTITYKPGFGSGTPADSTETVTATGTLTPASFTRNGYVFDGWTVTKTTGGASVATLGAADSVGTINSLTSNNPADLTFTAKWKAAAVTIGGKTVTATVGSTLSATVSATDLNAMTGTWTGDTYTWQVWNGSGWVSTNTASSNGVTYTITATSTGFTITGNGNVPQSGVDLTFFVRAKSNTNNEYSSVGKDENDYIKISCTALPNINGATNSGTMAPGTSMSLTGVTLDNGTTVEASKIAGAIASGKWVAAEYYHGKGDWGESGTTGPTVPDGSQLTSISSTNGTSITIPNTLDSSDAIWVKLTGDATNVSDTVYWVKIPVAKVEKKLTVKYVTVDADGNKESTQPSTGFTATTTESSLEAGETATISTQTTNSHYIFMGWTTSASGASPDLNDSATLNLSGSSHSNVGGSATFTMPHPAADTTLYAVYQKKAAKKITVKITLVDGTTATTQSSSVTGISGDKSLSNVAENETKALSTSTSTTATSSPEYIFLGWTDEEDSATPKTNISHLTIVSTGTKGGSATYTMPDPAADVTLYAIYKKVPEYTVTVIKGTGIDTVEANGSNLTFDSQNKATVKVKAKLNADGTIDTSAINLTLTSDAATYYTENGFTHNDTLTSGVGTKHKNITSATTSYVCTVTADGLEITANAKKTAPELTITPTVVGVGFEDSGTLQQPQFTVDNVGGADAKITGITFSDYKKDGTTVTGKTFTQTGITANTTVVNGSGTSNNVESVVTPSNNGKWDEGTYTATVTITYKEWNGTTLGDTAYTATAEVKYIVREAQTFHSEIIVKVDGVVKPGVSVKLEHLDAKTTGRDGKVTFTGLSKIRYNIKVDLEGGTDYYTLQNYYVDPACNYQIVEFFTVTVKLGNGSTEQDAVAAATDKVTLGLDGSTKDVTTSSGTADGSIAGTTLTKVVENRVSIPISATPSNSQRFEFDRWEAVDESNQAITSGLPTTSPGDIQVEEKMTLTAYLKNGVRVYVKYMPNTAHAPNVQSGGADTYVQNMPTSPVQIISGDAHTVSSSIPTLGGYVFKGWSTKDNRTAAQFNPSINNNATNGYDYAPGASITNITSDVTLYAVWEDAIISATGAKEEWTYGTEASSSDPFQTGVYAYSDGYHTNPQAQAITYTLLTGGSYNNLPGGLGIASDEVTVSGITKGKVYGIPFEVTSANGVISTVTLTLTTDYHDTTHKVATEVTYKATVGKATPTITNVTTTGTIIQGSAITSVAYGVDVEGPRFIKTTTHTANTASVAADWETYTDTIKYAATSGSKTDGLGTISFSPNTFASASTTNMTLEFTPGAVGLDSSNTQGNANNKFDTAADPLNNKQNSVWTTARKQQELSSEGATYTMKVAKDGANFNASENWRYEATDAQIAHQGYTAGTGNDGYVTVNTGSTADSVNAKDFTLKNFGNSATGKLTYTFSNTNFEMVNVTTTGNSDDPAYLKWTDIDNDSTANENAGLAVGADKKFRVKVKDDLPEGVYTGTLTITNEHNESITVALTFVVASPKPFEATITVKYQGTSDSSATQGKLPGSTTITLDPTHILNGSTPVSSTTSPNTTATVVYDSDNDVYIVRGLTTGSSYNLTVGNTGGGTYVIPSVTISASSTTAEVIFYEVKTAAVNETPATVTATQTGAGWYVKNQPATLTTSATATITGTGDNATTTTYDFKNWKWTVDDSESTSTNMVYNITAVTAPNTYTAVYKKQDAETTTVTYNDNKGSITGTSADIAVVMVTVGASHTINMNPAAPVGYTLKGWSTKNDRTAANFAPSTNNNATTGFDYTVGTEITVNSAITLYAIWEPITITADDKSLVGTYGVEANLAVGGTVSAIAGGKLHYEIDTSNSSPALPGGLKIDANTGVISGRPYVVTEGTSNADSGINVKVRITYVDNDGNAITGVSAKTVTVNVKVNKYQLQLTNSSVTNVVNGASITTGSYSTTVVSAPLYNGTTGGVDNWTTFTETTTNTTAPATSATTWEDSYLTLDPSTGNFGDVTSIELTYHPSKDPYAEAVTGDDENPDGTPEHTGTTDAHKNTYDAIYKPAKATVTPSTGNSTYTLTVAEKNRVDSDSDPVENKGSSITMWGPETATDSNNNKIKGFVADVGYTVSNPNMVATGSTANLDDLDGTTSTANAVMAQLFTLTNDGNQASGKLTYRFGTATTDGTDDTNGAAGTYFAIGTDGLPTTSLAAGGSVNFTVVPVAGLQPGTYRDTLVISSQYASVTIYLTLTVNAADVEFIVKTYHWDVTDESFNLTGSDKEAKLKNLVAGDVVLKPVAGGNDITLSGTTGKYTGNIAYDGTYYVEINGYRLRDTNGQYIIVDRNTKPADDEADADDPDKGKTRWDVDLYQLTTTTDPEIATANQVTTPTTAAPSVTNSAGEVAGALATDNKTGSWYVVKGETANVVAVDAPAGNGYSFKDYSDSLGTSLSISFTVNAPQTITANYAKGYTLDYNEDGGLLQPNDTLVNNGALYTLTPGETHVVQGGSIYKTGYTFNGWKHTWVETPTTGDPITHEDVYYPGDTFTMPAENVKLVAIWNVSGGLLLLPDTTLNAYYGEPLTGQLNAAQGTTSPSYSFGDNVTGPDWWDSALTIEATTSTEDGTTAGKVTGTPKLWVKDDDHQTSWYVDTITAGIKVTDTTNNKTATGTLTINVQQANTALRDDKKPQKKQTEGENPTDIVLVPGQEYELDDLITMYDNDTANDDTDDFYAVVDAMHSTWDTENGTNGTNDGDSRLSSNIPGTWSIKGADSDGKITAGTGSTQTITLVFTPEDPGFKSLEYDITYDVKEKAINGATIQFNFPVSGETAPKWDEDSSKSGFTVKAATDTINGDHTTLTDVVIKSAQWVGNTADGKFDTTTATTLIVVLTPKEANGTIDWPFTTGDFTGWFFDAHDNGDYLKDANSAKIDVEISHNTGEAVLMYTWPAEDRAFDIVNVNVADVVLGAVGNVSVTSAEPTKYSIEYKWYKKGTDTEASTFEDGQEYDLVVTFKPVDGWKFNDHFKGIAEDATMLKELGTEEASNEKLLAQVNGGYAPLDPKANTAETATNDTITTGGKGNIVVRYSAFKPQAKVIVGIEWVSGKLTNTDYYAVTRTDRVTKTEEVQDGEDTKNVTHITDVKRYTVAANNGLAYGHETYGSEWDLAYTNATENDGKLYYRYRYGDNTYSDPIEFTGTGDEKLVYGDSIPGPFLPSANASSALPNLLAALKTTGDHADHDHIFTNDIDATDNANIEQPATTGKKDQETFDGKKVYIAYTTGSGTFYAEAPIGTLTVQELKADKITASRDWTETELTFTVGNTFAVPSDITANVDYNSGSTLAKQETGFTHNNTQTNGNNTYYYKLDSDGDGDLSNNQIFTTGTTMTATMNGKTLYICHTDINGNEVATPVGVLKVNKVPTVWIKNTTDPEDTGADKTPEKEGSVGPEYGETIKIIIGDGDGNPPTGTTYKWYRPKKDEDGNPKKDGEGNIIWEEIPEATGPSYTVDKPDVGFEIKGEATIPGLPDPIGTVNTPTGNPCTLKLDVVSKDKDYDGTATNKYISSGDGYKTGNPWKTNDNGDDLHEENDFTLSKKIDSTVIDKAFGTSGDKVYVSAYPDATNAGKKYDYANEKTGSLITWPAIDDSQLVKDSTLANDKTVYRLSGDDAKYYRLGEQEAIPDRGTILGEGVIHVDVSFKEKPEYNHVIPGWPMGVTDLRQTTKKDVTTSVQPTVDAVSDPDFKFEVFDESTLWYKGAYASTNNSGTTEYPNGNPANDDQRTLIDDGYHLDTDQTTKIWETFTDEGTYSVAVTVRPVGDFKYAPYDSTTGKGTRFYFHFGTDLTVECGWPTTETVDDGNGNKHEKVTYNGLYPNGDGTYTMYYTFEITAPQKKIAHVNVSVPQPVVGKEQSGNNTPTINQILDNNGDVVPNGEVEVKNVTWTGALDGNGKYKGDVVYTVTFDLTVKSGSTYTYMNNTATPKDKNDVKFIISGVGPIEGEGSETGLPVITKVETVPDKDSDGNPTSKDTKYKVTVTYEKLTGGKVLLTDVVVDASPATSDTVVKTGPSVDSDKPYELTKTTGENPATDTSKSKWEYWNGTAWAAASDGTGLTSDGKFIAGYDYRVTATVTLTDTEHYTFYDENDALKTKFYLAGKECTTSAAANLHGTSDKKLTKIDDTTYQLIQEFSIPANEIDLITVTYKEPVVEGNPTATYETLTDTTEVNIPTTGGTEWYKTSLTEAPSATTSFTDNAVAANKLTTNDKFEAGKYYMVKAYINPNTGYAFKKDDNGNVTTKVNINGVLVTVGDSNVKAKYDAKGNEIGWAMAEYDSTNNKILAYYIAKTAEDDKEIVEITTSITAPVKGNTPSSAVSTATALNKDSKDLKKNGLTVENPSITWNTSDLEDGKFKEGTVYTATFTYKANTDDDYNFKVAGTDPSKDPAIKFTINTYGETITVTGEGTKTQNGVKVTTAKVDGSDDEYTVTVTFPATPAQDTEIVRIAANVTQPVAGATITAATKTLLLAQNKVGEDLTDGVTIGNLSWTYADGTATSDTTFQAGKQYKVSFEVSANENYSFLNDTKNSDWVDFLIENVTNADNSWINGEETTGVTKDNITVTATQVTEGVPAAKNPNKYTITITFPVVGTVADILSVWGFVDPEPVDGEEIADSDLTVKNGEPYRLVMKTVQGSETIDTDYTKWQIKDGTSYRDLTSSETQFLPGNTYKAIIRVEVKPDYAAKYQFTQSTAGYINGDTTGVTVKYLKDATNEATATTDTVKYIELTKTYTIPKREVDVIVNATVPAAGTLVGNITAKSGEPYELTQTSGATDTTKTKWQYWNGTTWTDASAGTGFTSDSKFIAGYDYRVIANVTLVDPNNYYDFTNSKFYLAGIECDKDAAPTVHPGANEKQLKKESDGTYTLIQEFSIPANEIDLITVTYKEPVVDAHPAVKPDSYDFQSQVTIPDNNAENSVTGTEWYKTGLSAAPTGAASFTGTLLTIDDTTAENNAKYAEGTYYMVKSYISANEGYTFKTTGTSKTQVTINGVLVTVDGDMGVKYDAEGTAIGWAIAKYNATTKKVEAYYIAKTSSTNKVIVSVTGNLTKPSTGSAPDTTVLTNSALTQDGRNVKDSGLMKGSVVGANPDITWTGTMDSDGNFALDTQYTATFIYEANTDGGYTFQVADTTVTPNLTDVKFTINGIEVVGEGEETGSDGTVVKTEKVSGSTNKYKITVTFPKTSGLTEITDVTVNYTAPVEGAAPAKSIVYTPEKQVTLGDKHTVENGNTNKLVTDGSVGSTWYKGEVIKTTTSPTGSGTAFDVGKQTVLAHFAAESGFKFTSSTKFIVNGMTYTATANPNNVVIADDGLTAKVYHTFDGVDKTIVKVIANATQPAAGDTIPTGQASLLLAQNKDGKDLTDKLTIGNMSWKYADGTSTTDTTFQVGKQYQVTFDVEVTGTEITNGYHFQAVADPRDYVDFLINNVKDANGNWIDGDSNGFITDATSGIKVKTVKDANSDDKYTITVVFPKVGKVSDVLTVWGFTTNVPAAGGTISSTNYNLHVLANEPYQLATDTAKTKWLHWNTTSGTWEDATGNFVAGEKYKAVITAEITDPDKYQFTTSTTGYINDTTGTTTVTRFKADGTTEATGSDAVKYIQLEREFTIDKETTDVHVSSPKPVKGNALPADTTITVPTGYTDKYEFTSKGWTASDGDTDNVKEDVTYTLTVTVKPKEGYELPTDKSNYHWDENNSTAVTYVKNADGTATVTFTYSVGGSAAQPKDPVAFIKPPVKGESPDKNPYSPNDSVSIVTGGTTWTDGSGNTVTGSFQPGNSYTAKIEIEPTSPDGLTTFKPGDVIDLDGEKVTVKDGGDGKLYIEKTWSIPKEDTKIEYVPSGGGGGGGGTTVVETPVVKYIISDKGTTNDPTAEKVNKNKYPKEVPDVNGIDGLVFKGWSETDPSTLKDGKLPTLVDPTTVKITGDKLFYAVYEKVADDFDHTHYVIGFPDGTFGPDHNITRGQVATIVARSCLENFVEGANYGNPGGYTDVENHWAFSAISYCYINGVFAGYEDGTFRPDRYITRQELATVVARLAGVQTNAGLPFSDVADIAGWAINGIYTNYANGWVNGYPDGTFRPLNEISRAETVKIFNGYLNRGTDKEGLSKLREYVHSGVASNNQENGYDEYMTWPDVAKSHWAYYEIIEAANDHNYHWRDLEKEVPPENWYECYIDEKWRYQDDENDGADDVGREDNLPVLTVTYVVKSNGEIWDSITEEVIKFNSPSVDKLPQAVPSEGYRFAGWSETDPDTGVISLVDPTASPVLDNKIFYAVFELEVTTEMPKVTVTYVIGDKGTTDMALTETVEMYQSPSVAALPQITAVDGYRFAGWSTTDPAISVNLIDPTAHYVTMDKTFYAVYEEEVINGYPTVTVTYVLGDHGTMTSGALTETIFKFDSPTVANLPSVTADEGYRFAGWSGVDPATGKTSLIDPTSISLTESKTFYAVYEALATGENVSFVEETPVQVEDEVQTGDDTQIDDAEQPGDDTQSGEQVEYVRTSYISGYTDNTFRPDAALTRAAVATVLAGLRGYDASVEYDSIGFDDLYNSDGTDHWGTNAINFCVAEGLMSGYTDNTFRPDNAISRQEFAIVLTRLAGETESGDLPFEDNDSIADWAWDSVYTAYAMGWIGGYDDGTFLPERNVTRAEAVKLFNAYLGRLANREDIENHTDYTVWDDVPETHWAYYEIIEASNNWAW